MAKSMSAYLCSHCFSCFALNPFVQIKWNRNATTCNYILHNNVLPALESFGKGLSSFKMSVSPCTKPGPQRVVFQSLVLKNWTGLHRALISTPSNTFGVIWDNDYCPISAWPHWCSCGWIPEDWWLLHQQSKCAQCLGLHLMLATCCILQWPPGLGTTSLDLNKFSGEPVLNHPLSCSILLFLSCSHSQIGHWGQPRTARTQTPLRACPRFRVTFIPLSHELQFVSLSSCTTTWLNSHSVTCCPSVWLTGKREVGLWPRFGKMPHPRSISAAELWEIHHSFKETDAVGTI